MHLWATSKLANIRNLAMKAGNQSMLVLAGSTMGEVSCDIELGQTQVISAKVFDGR